MYRPQQLRASQDRRGVILLVVLTVLTLFAVVGLSFVFYADAEATASRAFRDAQASTTQNQPDVDPEQAAAFFLAQFLFDVPDDSSGVFSSMRGHSLSRLTYGLNYGIQFAAPFNPSGTIVMGANNVPFSGTGRLHDVYPIGYAAAPILGNRLLLQRGNNGQQVDDIELVNYMYFPLDGFLRDPERYRTRPGLPQPQATSVDNRGAYVTGFNVPYTYPDRNNMFLAVVRADGTVALPSFFRPDTTFFPAANANTGVTVALNNWINSLGKYRILRPRPVDQLTRAQLTGAGLPYPLVPEQLNGAQIRALTTLIQNLQAQGQLFPYPEDAFGDVKNLVGTPGGNDSLWMDLGAPVMVLPDGRKYKMLFAPLIVDLDNRLNVNVHGNVRGRDRNGNPIHASNQGWGPWEVSLRQLITATDGNAAARQAEINNLFLVANTPYRAGRYGADKQPSSSGNQASSGNTPHGYAPVDLDGVQDNTFLLSQPFTLPAAGGYSPFPTFNPSAPAQPYYGNGDVFERTNHPLNYNVMVPAGDDRRYAASNLAALLRFGDTGSEFLSSELLARCPSTFAATDAFAARYRRLVTTHSFDFDRAGMTPWFYVNPTYGFVPPQRPNQPPQFYQDVYQTDYQAPTSGAYPTGGYPTWPNAGNASLAYPSVPVPIRFYPPPGLLNPPSPPRPQPQYFITPGLPNLPPVPNPALPAPQPPSRPNLPHRPPTGPFPTMDFGADWRSVMAALDRIDLNRPLPSYPSQANQFSNGRVNTANANVLAAFLCAQTARQQLAADIFSRLCRVAGLIDPTQTAVAAQGNGTGGDYPAYRWLAQLAVNIVDYIDEDYYVTPFNFNPNDGNAWVFGTELPRLVVNEAYLEFTPGQNCNAWVELYNPLSTDIVDTDPTLPANARGSVKLQMPAGPAGAAYPIYQLAIITSDANMASNTPANMAAKQTGTIWTTRTFTLIAGAGGSGGGTAWGTATGNNNPATSNNFVRPANGSQGGVASYRSNQGFYVIGPANRNTVPRGSAAGANNPFSNTTLQNGAMTFSSAGVDAGRPMSVVLQRLACPHLPYQNNPAQPLYNPYITVDYMDGIFPQNSNTAIANRRSYGRREPYAAVYNAANANNSQVVAQTVQPARQPFNTLFSANTPRPSVNGSNAYNWLVHLDRQVSSPMELLHVSYYRPHLLTQQFIDSNSNLFAHTAPWFDETARLYRAFEYLGARSRAAGLGPVQLNVANPPRNTLVAGNNRTLLLMSGANPTTTCGFTNTGVPFGIKPGDVIVMWDNTTNPATPVETVRVTAVTPTIFAGKPAGTFTANFQRNYPNLANNFITLTTLGDRMPGKINLNTVWEPEVLLGLCDPQTANSNSFASTDIYKPLAAVSPNNNPNLDDPVNPQTIYWRMMKAKLNVANLNFFQNPSQGPNPFVIGNATPVPFLSIAGTGYDPGGNGTQFPLGTGIQNTMLRADATNDTTGANPRLFEQATYSQQNNKYQDSITNRYLKYQLLTKTFGNMTSRSNVFAVWMTVGYFEVIDDSTMPVKLGAEIGRAQNRQVRHRTFAIVDRTAIMPGWGKDANGNMINATSPVLPVPPLPRQATINVSALSGTDALGNPWSIQVGDALSVDVPGNQETVTVLAVNTATNQITAVFTKQHPQAGVNPATPYPVGTLSLRPQPTFNPHNCPNLVPYFAVID